VLTAEGIGKSFLNSLTVAVPSTIIPISLPPLRPTRSPG